MKRKNNNKNELGTLYLIQSGDYLKIGYSKNLSERLTSYKTHNPNFKLLDTREGTFADESFLHKKLKKYLVKEYSEWMFYNVEVINIFKTIKLRHLTKLKGEKRDKIVSKIIKERAYKKWVREEWTTY